MDTTDQKLDSLMLDLRDGRAAPLSDMRRKVLILSTPRSGSTLFCDVLNRYGGLGECKEWFNFRYLLAYQRVTGVETIDIVEYFKFIVSRTLRGSDTFVANIHIGDYRKLLERDVDLLNINFDVILYLRRKKKLLQAISLSKAKLSDQWEAGTQPLLHCPTQPPISLISSSLNELLQDEHFYEENLRAMAALEFEYETISGPCATVGFKALFDILSIETIPATFETRLQRQSNQDASDLAREFLRHLQGNENTT